MKLFLSIIIDADTMILSIEKEDAIACTFHWTVARNEEQERERNIDLAYVSTRSP